MHVLQQRTVVMRGLLHSRLHEVLQCLTAQNAFVSVRNRFCQLDACPWMPCAFIGVDLSTCLRCDALYYII